MPFELEFCCVLEKVGQLHFDLHDDSKPNKKIMEMRAINLLLMNFMLEKYWYNKNTKKDDG